MLSNIRSIVNATIVTVATTGLAVVTAMLGTASAAAVSTSLLVAGLYGLTAVVTGATAVAIGTVLVESVIARDMTAIDVLAEEIVSNVIANIIRTAVNFVFAGLAGNVESIWTAKNKASAALNNSVVRENATMPQ